MALAAAMLGGVWNRRAMRRRCGNALTWVPTWVSAVIRTVVDSYPEPVDGEVLAEFVVRHVQSDPGRGPRRPRKQSGLPRVRRWYVCPPVMHARWGVPDLATPAELARWIGVEGGKLDALADRKGLERRVRDERLRNYRYRWIAKRSGGKRLLESPKSLLKQVQRAVLHGVIDRIPAHGAAHGFCRGRSVLSFVRPHVGAEVVVKVDLADFFLTTRGSRVLRTFRAAGYPGDVARTLTGLCTNQTPPGVGATAGWELRARLREAHLPQGAPTSPALANLCAFGLDTRLTALATAVGATYTRYADDLAFSGDREFSRRAPRFLDAVGQIVMEEGFAVNHRKTQVMPSSQRQRLAGVVLNGGTNIPRNEFDILKAILHNCVRRGPAGQNRDGHADFRAHLQGRIGWVTTLNPARGEKLRAVFETIVWGW